MLKTATVTMPYTELQALLNKNKEYKENLDTYTRINKMSDEEFDKDPFKVAMDSIFDLLEIASKQTKANEKQYYIYKSMEIYCKTFNIPLNELLTDVSKGVNPKRKERLNNE